MNFKLNRILTLTFSLLIVALFSFLGIVAIILPWSVQMQEGIARLLFTNPYVLVLFGLGLIFIGISLAIYTVTSLRRRYLVIQTGNLAVEVDEKAVRQYLTAYWDEHFPAYQIPFQLKIFKHSLRIRAELPSLPVEEQKAFLEKAKADFTDLFGRVIGYPYDVELVASFHSEIG